MGHTDPRWQRLVDVAWECLKVGQDVCSRPYVFVGDMGNAIARHAHKNRCTIVRDLCGHGVGLEFHEQPDVEHYGHKGTGMLLVPGMTFTIEPGIYLEGIGGIRIEDDILVTKDGCRILTSYPKELSANILPCEKPEE